MSAASRLPLIDALKAIASQLIVLHHLAFYGPMSDVANDLSPDLFLWLSQYARIAVQVFLVIGGFLAARSLSQHNLVSSLSDLGSLLKRRYFKLAIPFGCAMLAAIALSALARGFMDHDSIPGAPHWGQLIAHIFLLHSILGVDSLSAGVWYIAIDFQLFAMLAAILWFAERLSSNSRLNKTLAISLTGSLAALSLFYFNLDSDLDVWGIYFFGAYGMGVLAYWLTADDAEKSIGPAGLFTIAALGSAALTIDFRSRIAVALVTALVLGFARQYGQWLTGKLLKPYLQSLVGRAFSYLGQISYSVFLIHFPVTLVINGLVQRLAPTSPEINAIGIIMAWSFSIACGSVFYNAIESNSSNITRRLGWALRDVLTLRRKHSTAISKIS